MKTQIKDQFNKMLKFANNANEIAKNITLEKLETDIPYQYSLLYPLGQIGELAIYMTRDTDIEKIYSDIEWAKWRGFRNRIFHDYDMIDFSIVLEMIIEALPLLLIELQKIHGDSQSQS
jgi:uncharacterized protein with HEPN domain